MKTILTLLTALVLASCATTQAGICDDHGGVHSVSSDRPHVDVYCNDGTYRANW